MRKMLSGGLMVVGVMSAPSPISPRMTVPQHEYRSDPRLAPLRQFFGKWQCPAAEYAMDFLVVADTFELDWRLLPSVAFLETTGGKASQNNNLFGWDSGRAQFSSPSQAIRSVGSQLGQSPLYRSKGVDEILEIYNPKRDYARKVKSVMRQIAAVQ